MRFVPEPENPAYERPYFESSAEVRSGSSGGPVFEFYPETMTIDPISRLNAALAGRYRIEREIGEGGMAVVST